MDLSMIICTSHHPAGVEGAFAPLLAAQTSALYVKDQDNGRILSNGSPARIADFEDKVGNLTALGDGEAGCHCTRSSNPNSGSGWAIGS